MKKIKTIIKKILKILLITIIALFVLVSINNCSSMNKGKKVAIEEIINNYYINKNETMYLTLKENNGRIQINDNKENMLITFTFEIDNGVIMCATNNEEINEFSLIVYNDNSLYCRYFNEIFYKVEIEV